LGKSIVVKVLVNGGAESDETLVVVDPDIASKLGISSEELDVIEGTEWLPTEKLIGLLQKFVLGCDPSTLGRAIRHCSSRGHGRWKARGSI